METSERKDDCIHHEVCKGWGVDERPCALLPCRYYNKNNGWDVVHWIYFKNKWQIENGKNKGWTELCKTQNNYIERECKKAGLEVE